MGHKTGTNLGGIRTIECLKRRCAINPDSGCWEWRGASNKNGRQEPQGVVWLADFRKSTTLSQASWILSGKKKKDNQSVWASCRNSMCGNPEHMMVGTRAQYGAWIEKKGVWKNRPERKMVNRRNKENSKHCVLGGELALWIKDSEQPANEIAGILGCSVSAVSRARRGDTWANLAPKAASAFTWLAS